VIIIELERMEKDFALSEDAPGIPELEIYQRLSNTMRRLLEAVGLQRRPRDISPPHLRQYLHARAELTGESNTVYLSPASSSAGNRTGKAPPHDSVPLESDRDES
jgi:hypothetical protein